MNIFYVHEDPYTAAEMLVDKHVVKMILESAQLLSTAHRVLDGELCEGKTESGRKVKRYRLPDARDNILYQATHINHPSAVWCRETSENYYWLYHHFRGLILEYNERYNKYHACGGIILDTLEKFPTNIKEADMTKMPSCMDKEYIISDSPIINYRNYYKVGKSHLHKYTNRQAPEWLHG